MNQGSGAWWKGDDYSFMLGQVRRGILNIEIHRYVYVYRIPFRDLVNWTYIPRTKFLVMIYDLILAQFSEDSQPAPLPAIGLFLVHDFQEW
jgi:hypothetical protein